MSAVAAFVLGCACSSLVRLLWWLSGKTAAWTVRRLLDPRYIPPHEHDIYFNREYAKPRTAADKETPR